MGWAAQAATGAPYGLLIGAISGITLARFVPNRPR
jgi:hypothetical protein